MKFFTIIAFAAVLLVAVCNAAPKPEPIDLEKWAEDIKKGAATLGSMSIKDIIAHGKSLKGLMLAAGKDLVGISKGAAKDFVKNDMLHLKKD